MARPLDFNSPEGISSLLKSPMVSSPLLKGRPVTAAPSSVCFKKAVTSTPAPRSNWEKVKQQLALTEQNTNSQVEPPTCTKVTEKIEKPVITCPPLVQEETSRGSIGSSSSSGKAKKKRNLGRSSTNVH